MKFVFVDLAIREPTSEGTFRVLVRWRWMVVAFRCK
jgi:hypothetical protein